MLVIVVIATVFAVTYHRAPDKMSTAEMNEAAITIHVADEAIKKLVDENNKLRILLDQCTNLCPTD